MSKLVLPAQAELDRDTVRRRGLREFIRLAWPLVESVPFVDNWHIGAVAEHLEACQTREIRKLIINIPPGCMKSLTVSVFYPVWCWIQNPEEKFIYASYDASLSERDARRMRDIITSDWFIERWGSLLPSHALRQVRNFSNREHGFRFSTSVEGKMTGRHGDQLWVDDPIKPQDTIGGADSTRKMLDKCVTWYRSTMYNRMANPATTVHGLMMQRLHDVDLAGVLLEEGGWTHLMLPMRFEPKRACVTVLGLADTRTEDGELLWKERFPEPVTKDLENQLHQFASAQMQQNPVPATGGIFQREWLTKFWSLAGPHHIPGTIPLPDLRRMSMCQSWDMTFKKAADNDRVAGGVWGRQAATYFLLDEVCRRMSYTETKQAMRDLHAKWPRARAILVEDKANGSAILDEMSAEISGLIPVDPEGGKEARAWATSPLFKAGNVVLPHPSMVGYDWVKTYIEELARFPKAPHDDEVDQTTQALNYLSLHAPKWVGAMVAVLEREKGASEARARGNEAPPVEPIAQVDVAALRARLMPPDDPVPGAR